MPEHFAFYSASLDSLPVENLRQLAGAAEFSAAAQEDGGRQFVLRWPHVQLTCSEMPAAQLPAHLQGLAGWLLRIYQGRLDARGQAILNRLHATRLVVGVVVEPLRDEQGLADQVLGALHHGLDALMLFDSALFDAQARLLLAPDGSFDADAQILSAAREPLPATAESATAESVTAESVTAKSLSAGVYQPGFAQGERYERVRAQLQARQVPLHVHPLFVDDDDRVKLRKPVEVAQRVLVLSAVTLLAEGGARATALRLIDERQLWPAVSPEERLFLEPSTTDPELAQRLVWRLEGLWVLLWALGMVQDLVWPGQLGDLMQLIPLLERCDTDPHFSARARLRRPAEILDLLQTTLLLHWAIRDAWVHRRAIPEDLDWSGPAERIPVQQCPAVGVVAERHQALNWMVDFGNAGWDDVATPT